MSYVKKLNQEQVANMQYIIKRLAEKGFTNKYVISGVLAVVSKESNFLPKSEASYSGTSNIRIKEIFSRTRGLSDSELNRIKSNDELFFNLVYDNKIGNGKDEGYKYRGRGLNQLTGKANYENNNKYTSTDILKNPEKVNDIKVATDVLIGYFTRKLESKDSKISLYGANDINKIDSLSNGVGVIYHANTGWGKSKSSIENEPTGGYVKAIERKEEFLEIVEKQIVSNKKKKVVKVGLFTIGVLALLTTLGLLYKENKK